MKMSLARLCAAISVLALAPAPPADGQEEGGGAPPAALPEGWHAVGGDKKAARERVIELTEEAGMTGWHAGPVANSAAAEALTSILIQINRGGKISHSGIKIIGQEH